MQSKLEILLQNTNSCNNQCKVCSAGYANGNKNPFAYMSLDMFQNLLNKLRLNFQKDNIDIIFGTLNEPTTDPTLKEKVDMAMSQGFGTKIISNGKLVKQACENGINPELWIISILGGIDGDHGYEYITNIKLEDTLNTIEYVYNKFGVGAISLIIDPNDLRIIELITERFKDYKNLFIMLGIFYDRIFSKQFRLSDVIKAKETLSKNFGTIYDGCAESMLFGNINKCIGYNSITIDFDMNAHFCAEYIAEEFKHSYRDAFIKIGNIEDSKTFEKIKILRQYVDDNDLFELCDKCQNACKKLLSDMI